MRASSLAALRVADSPKTTNPAATPTPPGADPVLPRAHRRRKGRPAQGKGEDRAHDRAAEVRADHQVGGTYRSP